MLAGNASSTAPRRRPAALALGLAGALAAVLPGAAGAHELPNRQRHAISQGHVDAVGVHWEGGALSLRIHDDSGAEPVVRETGETLLHAKPESAFEIPAGIPQIYYDTLGSAGSTVWLLPQVQDPALLWPGWSSEEIAPGTFADDRLTWKLLSLDGPGELRLYQEGAFGLEPSGIRFNSADGLPDATAMSTGTHAHYSWAFSAPGLYKLRFEVGGTPAGAAAPVTSGPVEYRFFVGDLAELPDDPVVTTELSVGGLQPSYVEGETVALSAVQTPETGLHHYHWFTQCGDASDWTEVGGGGSHSFTAEARHDGCRYRVTLYGDDHAELATSPAVTIRVAARRGEDPAPPGDGQPPVVTPPGGPVGPGPVGPGPVPVQPGPGRARPEPPAGRRLTATVGRASLAPDGRRLTVRLRLDRAARVQVVVHRGSRRVTTARAVRVRAGAGTARLRLARALPPGRYRVVVKAASGGRTVTRSVSLHVRRAR